MLATEAKTKGPARCWPLKLQVPREGTCVSLLPWGGCRKSVARGDRSGHGCGREAVVEAELHDMELEVVIKVVPETASAAHYNVVEAVVVVTEVHEVVFELPGPVAPSPVFDARPDHPAGPRVVIVVEGKIIPVAEGPSRRTVVPQPDAEASIGKGAAALDIEQPVAGLAKCHAEARGDGRDPVAAIAAPEQVIARPVPREEAASVVVVIVIGDRGYLALDTPHVLADLVVEANLAAADEAALIAPEPAVVEADKPPRPLNTAVAIESVVAISIVKSPTDVAADVEAGPVVHDWSWWCRSRLQRHVRSLGGTPQDHSGQRGHSKQEQLSH
jgi:hypothetical protein